jgi:hypothetical protein
LAKNALSKDLKLFSFQRFTLPNNLLHSRPKSLADLANILKSCYDKSSVKEYCLYCGDLGG